MNSPTVLITGGCSYSQPGLPNRSWAMHLEKLHSIRYVGHTGQGAAGNQLISRKVISKVMEAIDLGYKTEDLLVGVMWSGCDRQSHFSPNIDHNYNKTNALSSNSKEQFIADCKADTTGQEAFYDSQDQNIKRHYHYNMANPVLLRNKNNPSHYILNSHWEDELTTTYFEHFVNPQKAIIETCEHILRTQWFLKDKGIKYFFTEYDFDVFHYMGPNPSYIEYSKDSECIQWPETYTREIETQHLTDPEINYLYSAIDRDYFLPIEHMQKWVTDVSVHKHPNDTDPHPGTEQHKDFTEQVILPFLLEKYNIGLYNV
tara:strand:+ start:147 stop:1091 length:945 start_codon:yes stop_codon:yes gene_type:complete